MKLRSTITLILLAFTLVFQSCDTGKLTRSKAKKMIQKHYGFPLAEGNEFDVLLLNGDKQKMQSKGLIEKSNDPNKQIIRLRSHLLTEYGKSFLIKGSFEKRGSKKFFMTNTLEVSEITGIDFEDDENSAKVEVTFVRNNLTPFGECYRFGGSENEVKRTVNFKKYDDGWRVHYPERLMNSVPLENVPHLNPDNLLNLKEGEIPKMKFITKAKESDSDELYLYLTIKGKEFEICRWYEGSQETNSFSEINNTPDESDKCIVTAALGGAGHSDTYCPRIINKQIYVYKNTHSRFSERLSTIEKIIR